MTVQEPGSLLSKIDVMNFLNEVSIDYPEAVSFASGRPTGKYFDLDEWTSRMPLFVEHFAEENGIDVTRAARLIGQYGRTKGLINELVARQVKCDEHIDCRAEDVVITSGCQEAMLLAAKAVVRKRNEVLLVCDPTYIGITGLAATHGIPLAAVRHFSLGDFMEALEAAVQGLARAGKKARALYLIPDFDNPTGAVMALPMRRRLLEFCRDRRITILEDNPYGLFRYEQERLPTLYELDDSGVVVYLGTYSKILCPGVRVGYLIVPPALHGDREASKRLKDAISRMKSFVTVNTGQIPQAIVGGVLLHEGGTVARLIEGARRHYLENRDVMLRELQKTLGGREDVSWTFPTGGFFLALTVDFDFLEEETRECAKRFGVICMPMAFFSFGTDFDRKIRLAFSNAEPEDIVVGVRRLAAYLESRDGRMVSSGRLGPDVRTALG